MCFSKHFEAPFVVLQTDRKRLSPYLQHILYFIQKNISFTDIKHSFHTVLKKAEINNFRFHDLRHTAATRMSECGVPVPVIQDILGHCKRTYEMISCNR